MNVTATNWQSSANAIYQTYSPGKRPELSDSSSQSVPSAADTDILERSSSSVMGLNSDSSQPGSNFKMKASGPDNSVGELAAMLSRAETTLDVQQVMSKAMRAMTQLKMCAVASEGKDAKKYARQIKRMEKLIKRIQKKLKHLSKEQRMEEQREKALKNEEKEKAKQIAEELKAHRKKRRREERRYALRELSEDQKESNSELMSSMSDALSAGSTPDISGLTGMGGDLMGAGGVDLSGIGEMSIDISV